MCIDCVNQVKKLAWSGVRSLVSAQSRRGKKISIAQDLLSRSLSVRLIAIHSLEGSTIALAIRSLEGSTIALAIRSLEGSTIALAIRSLDPRLRSK